MHKQGIVIECGVAKGTLGVGKIVRINTMERDFVICTLHLRFLNNAFVPINVKHLIFCIYFLGLKRSPLNKHYYLCSYICFSQGLRWNPSSFL
ncbi:hypothetical protein IC575_003301 [Cucumis melo]